jgi:hypothetical protein
MAPLLIPHTSGLIIYVYAKKHLPPHIHVFYGDDEVLVEIRTGRVFAGFIPSKKMKIVEKWLKQENN